MISINRSVFLFLFSVGVLSCSAGGDVAAATDGPFEGYTLFAPLRSKTTYLVDMEGEVVHQWEADLTPGNSVYLMDNGDLFRAAKVEDPPVFEGGGQGGRVQKLAPDGTVIWDFLYSTEEYLHHHDIEPLPNGNVLLIAWEGKTKDEALAAGRHPTLMEGEELWPDMVVEIEPVLPDGGKVVWEWHVWDHLIQDVSPDMPNYGRPFEHPERVDINGDRWRHQPTEEEQDEEQERLAALGYAGGPPPEEEEEDPDRRRRRGADWLHTNGIDYHEGLDQIILSVRKFSEVWVIDHGTTTEEAKGPKGDLLWRWGNPQSWQGGDGEDRRLFVQHDAQWIPEGFPGAGNILVFNNGEGRDGNRPYSTVDEIVPPLNPDGSYRREEDGFFGPFEATWTYKAEDPKTFFSGHISGAQRLPNGNTLICEGAEGRFFEVTSQGEVVWEYLNSFGEPEEKPQGGRGPRRGGGPDRRGPGGPGGGRPPRGPPGPRDGPPDGPPEEEGGRPDWLAVFRATRLAPDHPGLAVLLAQEDV